MAQVDPYVMDQMAAAYQQSLSRLSIAAELAVEDVWYSHDSFDSTDDEEWEAAFWLVVATAGAATAALTREYVQTMGAYVGIMASLPPPDLDWLADDFAKWNVSPPTMARWRSSEGDDSREAIRVAGGRASKLTAAVMRQAEQETFEQMLASFQFEFSWEYEIDDTPNVPNFPTTVEEADRIAATRTDVKRTSQPKYRRMTQADACGWCRVVADRVYTARAYERNPLGKWHAFCVPGETLVQARGIRKVASREYRGDLVVIRTAFGHELACTPNHPIATEGGFVPAEQLRPGDQVLSALRLEGIGVVDVDDVEKPSPIKDVASAFIKNASVTTMEVEVAPEDFHGDGVGSKVGVVAADGLLWGEGAELIPDHSDELSLGRGLVAEIALAGEGSTMQAVLPDLHSPHGLMRRGHLPLTLGHRHLAPLEPFGFGAAPWFNPPVQESIVDDATTDTKALGDALDRLTGQIGLDYVVSIDRRVAFFDHVYNLETEGGWYIAGGIVTHNCRCSWRRLTDSEAAAFSPQYGDGQWRTVQQERFNETGDPGNA